MDQAEAQSTDCEQVPTIPRRPATTRHAGTPPETGASAPQIPDLKWSREDLLVRWPDKRERIEVCVINILNMLAGSCLWSEWRELAQVYGESLVIDTDSKFLSPAGVRQMYQDMFPIDENGDSLVEAGE